MLREIKKHQKMSQKGQPYLAAAMLDRFHGLTNLSRSYLLEYAE